MLDLKIVGLIIEPTQSALPNPNLDLYCQLQNYHIPTILFHSTYPGFSFPTLLTKDLEAEKELTKYLFKLGHSNILGIFQINDQQGVNRMSGMVQAYQEENIPITKSNIVMYQSNDAFTDIVNKADTILKAKPHITAIACYNDELATRIISHLQSQGLQVPHDISVVGFDNYEMAQLITPKLTTVNHPKRQLGEDAGEMIIDMINDKSVTSKFYTPQIIKRDSAILVRSKEN